MERARLVKRVVFFRLMNTWLRLGLTSASGRENDTMGVPKAEGDPREEPMVRVENVGGGREDFLAERLGGGETERRVFEGA